MPDEEHNHLEAEDLLDDDLDFDFVAAEARLDFWCLCFLLAVAVGLFLLVHFVGVP